MIWLQLTFLYVWQGKKDYAQLTLFVAIVFGSAALQVRVQGAGAEYRVRMQVRVLFIRV